MFGAAPKRRRTDMTPITLYHCPRSRSSNAVFLLEELGVPYEIGSFGEFR